MSLLDLFKQEQWDALPVAVGPFQALAYDVVMPKDKVRCLVWEGPGGGHLFHTSALNSFSDGVAEVVVGRCQLAAPDLPDENLVVLDSEFGDTAPFETVVVAPPSIALFEHLSEPVRSHMYVVAPAYHSEFNTQMSGKDFRHQMGRKDGWRVYVYRWDRPEKKAPSWS